MDWKPVKGVSEKNLKNSVRDLSFSVHTVENTNTKEKNEKCLSNTSQSPTGYCDGESQYLLFKTICMNEKRIIDMMQRIEKYILGKLTQKEIDELWIEFLKDPEWYIILKTDLRHYFTKIR